MEVCIAGGVKLLGGFYQSHGLATDACATFVGLQVGVRGTCAAAKCLLRPVVERVNVIYYQTARKLRDGFRPPLWVYTAPASLCCMEGIVKERVMKRRQELPVVSAKTRSSGVKPTLTPIFDSELGCHVLYEHPNSVPLKLQVREVDSLGFVKWDVVRAKPAALPKAATESGAPGIEGDEKRIKRLEPMPGWDISRISDNFGWMVILILDNRPYKLNFRCNENEFHTPYHMGPLDGKKLEICGVQDYCAISTCVSVQNWTPQRSPSQPSTTEKSGRKRASTKCS